MEKLLLVTDATFKSIVLEAVLPILVDFTADWCGPCRVLKPILEKAAEAYVGKVGFVVVDVDAHVETAQEYSVLSIPTLVLFNAGKVVGSLVGVGARPRDEIDALIARLAVN